jgi:hypothetical protein
MLKFLEPLPGKACAFISDDKKVADTSNTSIKIRFFIALDLMVYLRINGDKKW